MRLLFTMDRKDYDPKGEAYVRPSVRAVLIRDGKIAMVHSRKYDYYKFPGGGIEPGENQAAALIRETAEEAGLKVIPESIHPYGYVHRVKKGDNEPRFIQDNYYYCCEAAEEGVDQKLDDYEREAGFSLEYVFTEHAIAANRRQNWAGIDQNMLEREALVLEMLIKEGFFS